MAAIHLRRLLLLAALATGCVFGYRGAVPFAGQAALAGLDTVMLELPPTDLELVGSPDASSIRWQGRFVALGASPRDALASAEQLELSWETWQRVGRLYADLPIDLEDISELEQLRVDSLSHVAHEITGAGTVSVEGIDAFLAITLSSGSVEVQGGLDEIRVTTGAGWVALHTGAAVVVDSGDGAVDLELEDPRSTLVTTAGPVDIAVAISDDLAIDIAEAGVIVVELDGVAHVGKGSFQRNLGAGTRPMRVRAGGGRVDLRMLE